MAKSKSSQDNDFGWLEDKPRENSDNEQDETTPIVESHFEPTMDLDDLEVEEEDEPGPSDDDTTPLPPMLVDPIAIAANADGEVVDATDLTNDETEEEKSPADDSSDRDHAVPIPPLIAIGGDDHADDPLHEEASAPVPIPNLVTGLVDRAKDSGVISKSREGIQREPEEPSPLDSDEKSVPADLDDTDDLDSIEVEAVSSSEEDDFDAEADTNKATDVTGEFSSIDDESTEDLDSIELSDSDGQINDPVESEVESDEESMETGEEDGISTESDQAEEFSSEDSFDSDDAPGELEPILDDASEDVEVSSESDDEEEESPNAVAEDVEDSSESEDEEEETSNPIVEDVKVSSESDDEEEEASNQIAEDVKVSSESDDEEEESANPIAEAISGKKRAEEQDPVERDSNKKEPSASDDRSESDSDEENETENPISASVRDAASKKADPSPRSKVKPGVLVSEVIAGESIFLVDRASDGWIAEDSAEPKPGKVTPTKKRTANARSKRKRGFLGVVSMIFFVFALLFVAVGIAAWFARDYLVNRVENLAIQKLEAEGVFLKYSGRTFEFPRGLVLTDVELFETAEKEKHLLKVGNFGVDTDLWHLLSIRSADGLKAVVTIENAQAELFNNGGKVCDVTGLSADLLATQKLLNMNRLRGTLNGLDFDIEGTVNLPEPVAETADATPEELTADNESTGPILDFSPLSDLAKSIAFTPNEGESNPLLRMNIELGPDGSLHANGRFSGRGFTWQEVPFDFASVGFDYSQKLDAIDLMDLQLGYEGGSVSGKMQIFPGQDVVNIDNLTSTVNPVSLASHFTSDLEEALAGIKLIDNPTIGVTGKLNLTDFWSSLLVIDYHQWDGFTIAIGENSLPVSALNGQFILKEGTVRTESFKASFTGGATTVKGQLNPNGDDVPFSAIIELDRLPIENLSANKELKGLLSGQFRGRGQATNLAALTGTGNIQIESGKLYSVPVIGPIQNLLATVSPVFGNRVRSTLQASYVIEAGNLRTSDLDIRSEGTRVKVKGGIDLSNLTTDFDATASLEGPLGLAAELSSDMLTVSGKGPVTDPQIELKNVPKGLSDTVQEGLDAITNLLGEDSPTTPPTEVPAGTDTPSTATPELPPAPSNNLPVPAPSPDQPPSTEQ